MFRLLVLGSAVMVAIACGAPAFRQSAAPSAVPQQPPLRQISVTLEQLGCSDSDLELVIPFYEGIQLRSPRFALGVLQVTELELVYPSPLSLPAFAWRCRGREWNVIGAGLDELPVVLRLRKLKTHHELSLTCLSACQLRAWTVAGELDALARSFTGVYDRPAQKPPLARQVRELRFYVHQWLADAGPALRTEWSIDQLSAELAATPEDALAVVHGWDPAGIDLGGRYFWSDGAEQRVTEILRQERSPKHLAWLNLRTFKYAIPRLGLRARPSPELERGAWRGPDGKNIARKYAFEAMEMCLCSDAWQRTRLAELERLAKLGFQVIQLDEFPVAMRWHAAACLAAGHEHAPGDFTAEWDCSLRFVRALAERAQALGLILTSEAPSAALLGLTQGYIERQPNWETDVYGFWTRSAHVRPIPLFSAAFGDRTTAYTDIDPGGAVPPNWLRMHKQSPDAAAPADTGR
jgi:hypothetical protein